jgi:hypothetical protein
MEALAEPQKTQQKNHKKQNKKTQNRTFSLFMDIVYRLFPILSTPHWGVLNRK